MHPQEVILCQVEDLVPCLSLNVLPNCEIQGPGVVPGGLGMGHLLKIPNPNPVVPRTLQRSPTSPCRFQIAFGKKLLLKPVTGAMKLGSQARKQAPGKPGLRRHRATSPSVQQCPSGVSCTGTAVAEVHHKESTHRAVQKSGNPMAQAWVHTFATARRSQDNPPVRSVKPSSHSSVQSRRITVIPRSFETNLGE